MVKEIDMVFTIFRNLKLTTQYLINATCKITFEALVLFRHHNQQTQVGDYIKNVQHSFKNFIFSLVTWRAVVGQGAVIIVRYESTKCLACRGSLRKTEWNECINQNLFLSTSIIKIHVGSVAPIEFSFPQLIDRHYIRNQPGAT